MGEGSGWEQEGTSRKGRDPLSQVAQQSIQQDTVVQELDHFDGFGFGFGEDKEDFAVFSVVLYRS